MIASGALSGIDSSTGAATLSSSDVYLFPLNDDVPLEFDVTMTIAYKTSSSGSQLSGDFKLSSPVALDKACLLYTSAAVPFKFKHVLSRANFWAKLDGSVNDSETKVFIKGVKLLGTSIEAPSAANSSSKFYTKATYKWEDGLSLIHIYIMQPIIILKMKGYGK